MIKAQYKSYPILKVSSYSVEETAVGSKPGFCMLVALELSKKCVTRAGHCLTLATSLALWYGIFALVSLTM